MDHRAYYTIFSNLPDFAKNVVLMQVELKGIHQEGALTGTHAWKSYDARRFLSLMGDPAPAIGAATFHFLSSAWVGPPR